SPSKAEETLRLQVAFAQAELRAELDDPENALQRYLALAEHYRERVEHLHALAGARRCYWMLYERDSATYRELYRSRLEVIARALGDLSDAALGTLPGDWTRKDWEAWLADERQKDVGRLGAAAPASSPSAVPPPG